MKPVLLRRNSVVGSAVLLRMQDEDIVYSPNKYRETEGTKEIKLRESFVSLCQRHGMIGIAQRI